MISLNENVKVYTQRQNNLKLKAVEIMLKNTEVKVNEFI